MSQMPLPFYKIEGIGNDFIVTHHITADKIEDCSDVVSGLCDRRYGIGGDGVVFIEPSEAADYRMRIFNSDGSEAEMCGNGIRCLVEYLKATGVCTKNTLTIETLAGIIGTGRDGDSIRVNMGKPILDAPSIPVAQSEGRVVMHELTVGDTSFRITAVSMGNPHTVIFTDDISDTMVSGYGPKIEPHPFFPKKTNVEFVKIVGRSEITMRVYERGCGETLACGTGACGAVVAGIVNEFLDHDVLVRLPGGNLRVAWEGVPEAPVYLTGPARVVFEGTVMV
jgi:diaminopimelate epimerase